METLIRWLVEGVEWLVQVFIVSAVGVVLLVLSAAPYLVAILFAWWLLS
jgi:hypothetical protein